MNCLCFYRVFQVLLTYVLMNPLFLQDDHATQRGTIPAQAVDQEAIPEELSEGVSNEVDWRMVDVIIGTILGVIGMIVACVLRKIV